MSSLGIFEIFFKLFIVAIVLFLAYVVTRFMGLKYMNNLKGKNILVVESISIGLDKMLYIVKIGRQYFLISSSGKSINFLSEIDATNISLEDLDKTQGQQMFDVNSFAKYLDFFKAKQDKKVKKEKQQTTSESNSGQTQYSYFEEDNQRGIEKNIDKIKDISKNIKTPRNGVE